jgi:hypothetical protein
MVAGAGLLCFTWLKTPALVLPAHIIAAGRAKSVMICLTGALVKGEITIPSAGETCPHAKQGVSLRKMHEL